MTKPPSLASCIALILSLPSRAERRQALDRCPHHLRKEIEAGVNRYWHTRNKSQEKPR